MDTYQLAQERDAETPLAHPSELGGDPDAGDLAPVNPEPEHRPKQVNPQPEDFEDTAAKDFEDAADEMSTPDGEQDTPYVVGEPSTGPLWEQFIRTNGNDSIRFLRAGRDGAIYAFGSTQPYRDRENEFDYGYVLIAFVAKYDETGALLWLRDLEPTGGKTRVNDAVFDADENFYVTGDTTVDAHRPQAVTHNGYPPDAFVAKYDARGALLWRATEGTQGFDAGMRAVLDQDSNVYITGNAGTSKPLDSETAIGIDGKPFVNASFVAMYDRDGTLQWLHANEELPADIAALLASSPLPESSGGLHVRIGMGDEPYRIDRVAGVTGVNGRPTWDARIAKYAAFQMSP